MCPPEPGQMLLSMIAIILTIADFSGASIIRPGVVAWLSIACGLLIVLLSTLTLMAGPLLLHGGSCTKSETVNQSLIDLIKQRSLCTHRSHLSRDPGYQPDWLPDQHAGLPALRIGPFWSMSFIV